MKEQANKLQAVMNTLQELNIPATMDNMGKLMACQQLLAEVRDDLYNRKDEGYGDSQTE